MKIRRKTTELICCIMVIVMTVSGCSITQSEPNTVPSETVAVEPKGKVYFSYFDTASYVYSYAGDTEEEFDQRASQVSELLKEYHQLFDIYHEYTDINNLCTVNRLAGGESVKVDKRLIDFLSYAKNLYVVTNGEMNIMLGSVLSIWHEYRTHALDNPSEAKIPDDALLKEAAEHTDISLLEIDEENCTVRIADEKASIDVGALGKGYATERAADLLKSLNAFGYVLNVGGNIRAIGTKNDGSFWDMGIKDPNNPDAAFSMKLKIADAACVTSGNYERYYTVNGVKYHHIIDKDTLYPAQYFASVSIITDDSGLADGLSTALFCMPYEEGKAIAEKLGNVEVIWIYEDGAVQYTDGIKELIS